MEDVIDSSLSFLTKNQRQVSTISDDENSYVKCLAVVLTSRQLPLARVAFRSDRVSVGLRYSPTLAKIQERPDLCNTKRVRVLHTRKPLTHSPLTSFALSLSRSLSLQREREEVFSQRTNLRRRGRGPAVFFPSSIIIKNILSYGVWHRNRSASWQTSTVVFGSLPRLLV